MYVIIKGDCLKTNRSVNYSSVLLIISKQNQVKNKETWAYDSIKKMETPLEEWILHEPYVQKDLLPSVLPVGMYLFCQQNRRNGSF